MRKEYFLKKHFLDHELSKIVDNIESYQFIKEPLTQYMHIYLAEYLIGFSRKWFEREKIKILDWGCGKCQVTYLLRKRNMETVSCDIENGKGDSAFNQHMPIAEHAGIEIVPLRHAYNLPFENETFDVVLSFGVLEHVENDFESLKEIQRILKPKGLFFCFFLPYKYSYRTKILHLMGDFYHDHLYDYKIVNDLMKKAGMEIIDFWYRDVLPLKSYNRNYRLMELLDYWFCNSPIIKHLSSNIEFVASKGEKESPPVARGKNMTPGD